VRCHGRAKNAVQIFIFFQKKPKALFNPPDRPPEGGNFLPLSLPSGKKLPVGSNLTSCECGGRF